MRSPKAVGSPSSHLHTSYLKGFGTTPLSVLFQPLPTSFGRKLLLPKYYRSPIFNKFSVGLQFIGFPYTHPKPERCDRPNLSPAGRRGRLSTPIFQRNLGCALNSRPLYLVWVGKLELPAIARPADEGLTGLVSEQFQQELPQLDGSTA